MNWVTEATAKQVKILLVNSMEHFLEASCLAGHVKQSKSMDPSTVRWCGLCPVCGVGEVEGQIGGHSACAWCTCDAISGPHLLL